MWWRTGDETTTQTPAWPGAGQPCVAAVCGTCWHNAFPKCARAYPLPMTTSSLCLDPHHILPTRLKLETIRSFPVHSSWSPLGSPGHDGKPSALTVRCCYGFFVAHLWEPLDTDAGCRTHTHTQTGITNNNQYKHAVLLKLRLVYFKALWHFMMITSVWWHSCLPSPQDSRISWFLLYPEAFRGQNASVLWQE